MKGFNKYKIYGTWKRDFKMEAEMTEKAEGWKEDKSNEKYVKVYLFLTC